MLDSYSGYTGLLWGAVGFGQVWNLLVFSLTYTRFPVVGLMFLWVYGLGFGVYELLRFGVRGLRVQGLGFGV